MNGYKGWRNFREFTFSRHFGEYLLCGAHEYRDAAPLAHRFEGRVADRAHHDWIDLGGRILHFEQVRASDHLSEYVLV
jgi:hypothetical protein